MEEFEYEVHTKYEQESEYKKRAIIIDLCYGFFLVLFGLFLLIMVIRKTILEWEISQLNEMFRSWWVLLFIIAIFFYGYLFIRPALVRYVYYKLNQKEEIQIDTENKLILILDKIKKTRKEIKFVAVKSVEVYCPWNFVNVSDLGYTKLVLENDSNPIIITQRNIAQYHFCILFEEKKVKTFNKFFHKLDVLPRCL